MLFDLSDSPCSPLVKQKLEFFVFPPGGVALTGLIQNTQTNCSTTPAATVSKTPPHSARIYPPHTCSFTTVHPCLHDDCFTHLSPWLPPCMRVSLAMAQHSATKFAHCPPTSNPACCLTPIPRGLDVNTSDVILRHLFISTFYCPLSRSLALTEKCRRCRGFISVIDIDWEHM